MRRLIAALIIALPVVLVSPAGAQAPAHSFEHVTVTNPGDGTSIVITVFKPAAASAGDVPVILQSHGWGGSRSKSIGGEIASFLDAGFGVVSIDQRGHGDSGGQANVQDPDLEAEDIDAVIDHVAALSWVLHEDAAGTDPVLGAIGGSYGGGYQTMSALDEIAEEGGTRLDALAPEITWYDLNESLAPQKVVRTAWVTALYGAGAPMVPDYIHEAFAWGASTGLWPDGTIYDQPVPGTPNIDAEFHTHGPIGFVEQGVKLDIPVLQRQGASDNLFNLNQGLDIFHKALTDEARSESYFVSFNGGHALPNAAPPGAPTDVQLGGGVDACSGNWTQLRIEFFSRALFGQSTDGLMPAQYNFTDLGGKDCIRFGGFDSSSVAVDPLGAGATISTTAAGAPMHYEIAQGPTTITGVPTLEGLVTAAGLDSRAFFGLAVGTSPADAKVVQNNLMPLRVVRPDIERPFNIELPGVGVNVPEGKSLFLTVSPISDMYFGHGSRTPGGLVLSDLTLTLPSPGVAEEEPQPVASALSLRREGQGSKARLVATLTDAQTGAGISDATISFSSEGASLGSATTNGSGVATLPLQGKYRNGKNAYSANFAGNDDYLGSSASS